MTSACEIGEEVTAKVSKGKSTVSQSPTIMDRRTERLRSEETNKGGEGNL